MPLLDLQKPRLKSLFQKAGLGLLSLSLSFGFCLSAVAEYRAYELLITNTATGTERRVLASLDHLQYPMYYPLNPSEQIGYITSWMCRGRTDSRPICPNPKALQLVP